MISGKIGAKYRKVARKTLQNIMKAGDFLRSLTSGGFACHVGERFIIALMKVDATLRRGGRPAEAQRQTDSVSSESSVVEKFRGSQQPNRVKSGRKAPMGAWQQLDASVTRPTRRTRPTQVKDQHVVMLLRRS